MTSKSGFMKTIVVVNFNLIVLLARRMTSLIQLRSNEFVGFIITILQSAFGFENPAENIMRFLIKKKENVISITVVKAKF